MKSPRIRLFLFLIFSPIFGCLLFISPHHAIAQVYYCADDEAVGFDFDKKANKYTRRGFIAEKFKIQLDLSNKSITKKYDGQSEFYTCIIPWASLKNVLSCQYKTYHFNFNSHNGRYVFSLADGYVTGDGDSISISYGTCDEF